MKQLPLDVTMEALSREMEGSYLLADMRSEQERERGSIPGAVALSAQALETWQPETDVPVVLVCARGVFSRDAALALRERGICASSLTGGYPAWLLYCLRQQETDACVARVEAGFEKKYRQRLWSKFTRAIRTYDLLQPGDRVAVCISGGKDSMLMAKLFQKLKRHSRFPFEVELFPFTSLRRISSIPSIMCPNPPAICARGCGAAICTALPKSSAATKLRWATISTT